MDDFKLKILPLIINGHYTDWFFSVFLGQLYSFLRNNLELLLLFAFSWQKFAKITKSTWDDKASGWLINFLSRWSKPKIGENKNEKTVNDSNF